MCIIDALAYVSPVFASIQAQREEYKLAKHRNKQLIEEAKQAEENAGRERQEGIEEARNKKLQSILKMGENTSKMASNNISTSSSMLLNLNANEKLNAELDALNTLNDYNKRADNYVKQADKAYSDYGLGRYNQRRIVRNGIIEVQNQTYSNALKIATMS